MASHLAASGLAKVIARAERGPGAPGSTWRSSAASWWRSSAPAGRARARSCTCWACSTRPTRRRSGSTAGGSTTGPTAQRDALRNRTFGFIFQFYHLLPELSALENVMMPQMIRHGFWSYWRHRKQIRTEADGAAGAGGAGAPARPPAFGALRRRDAAGRDRAGPGRRSRRSSWPTSRPGTSTPATGQGVLELLRDLNRERGLTMMMVTHDIQIAQQADRVVRLAEGRIEEWAPALA